jgi:dihydrofolate reductase
MGKLVVTEMVTLDGVAQAPSAPDEDREGGFVHRGWQAPLFYEQSGEAMFEQAHAMDALLLGRKTYEIFAAYWPHHKAEWPGSDKATKYVATRTLEKTNWDPTVLIKGDVASEIRKLKDEDRPDLQVHGSGDLIQTLLKQDLVDELWLKTFPVTLGPGKRLFAAGAVPAGFKLLESRISPAGVIIANYGRAGAVKTGSFA